MKISPFIKSTLSSFIIFSLMFFSLGNVVAVDQWTICHATGSASHPYSRIVVSDKAQGGHFDNNGDPTSAHALDLLFEGDVTCPSSLATPTSQVTATPTASPVPTPSPTQTSTPTQVPSSTPVMTPTSTPSATPTATPVVVDQTPTPSPVLGDSDMADACLNIDGIQADVPADYHLDASGVNCVQFSQSGGGDGGNNNGGQVLGTSTIGSTNSSSTNKQGQVLGASTLGATGTDQKLMIALYILGGLAVSCGVGVYSFSKEDLVVDRDPRI
jgi:hypothetical protein